MTEQYMTPEQQGQFVVRLAYMDDLESLEQGYKPCLWTTEQFCQEALVKIWGLERWT